MEESLLPYIIYYSPFTFLSLITAFTMIESSHNSASHAGRSRPRRPRVGITMGDPAGIGPEVVLKAVAEDEVRKRCVPVIIGDAQLLAHTARTLDLTCGYDIARHDEPFPQKLHD